MTKQQRTVALGAGAGVATMAVALLSLSSLLTGLPSAATAGERLANAVQWIAVAAVPLLLSIIAVGNARFNSSAIDPTLGLESRATLINGRVVDNTLQQYAVFMAAVLAVAAGATGPQTSIVAAAALIFVFMRLCFWIGYQINPLYRAFGMAGTMYLNVALIGYAAWIA